MTPPPPAGVLLAAVLYVVVIPSILALAVTVAGWLLVRGGHDDGVGSARERRQR